MVEPNNNYGEETEEEYHSTFIGKLVEFIPDKLYFGVLSNGRPPKTDAAAHYFTVDDVSHYESFYNDFGPLNLAVLYRYCDKIIQKKLRMPNLSRKRLIHYTSSESCSRVNAAYLIGSFAILHLEWSVERVMSALSDAQLTPFIPFRDAAMGPSTYDLHLQDVFRAVKKAASQGWLCWDKFNCREYEWYERVENGDLNWIVPNKILAFCGPHQQSTIENGYPYHAPEVYFDYFRTYNVRTVIRLNKKLYDIRRFTNAGFEHVDLFFVDGSTPSDLIVRKFLDAVDKSQGAVAVHCKAGLGRTGTLIACWMMKQLGWTAPECIAWTRICRPGSIIGPQQQFLLLKQNWCFGLGGKQSEEKGLNHLTSKVDDINLGVTLSIESQEMKVDGAGGTQGDRLLQIKATKQTQARFTSPTTPVKPLSGRLRRVDASPPASRKLDFGAGLPRTKVARTSEEAAVHPPRILRAKMPRARLQEPPAVTAALAGSGRRISAPIGNGNSSKKQSSFSPRPRARQRHLTHPVSTPLLPALTTKDRKPGYHLRPRRFNGDAANGRFLGGLPRATNPSLGHRKVHSEKSQQSRPIVRPK